MRHKIHNKVSIEKGNEVKKRGFTLVELLAVVVIITLVAGIGITIYLNAIKKSKEQATLLAIDGVKSAAELYSKENTGEIKWIYQYDDNGKEKSQYICMTVQQLINNGYFNEDFFNKDIYNNQINSNTYIEINRDLNSSNTEVKIHNEDTSENECEMSAINDKLHELNIKNLNKWTDRLKFEFSSKNVDDDGKVTYSCYDENAENKYKDNECVLDSLNDDSYYKIRICMSPIEGVTTTLKSTVCNYVSLNTAKFEKPTIEIENENSWKNKKNVTISYNNSNIYELGKNAYHYFKSEVDAEVVYDSVKNGSFYLCDDFKDGENNNCSNVKANRIEANKWYKVVGDEVELNVNTNLEKNVKKKITARIQDGTGNYLDSNKNISKIDSKPPECSVSGGSTTWINKSSNPGYIRITATCSDNHGGSGCKTSSFYKDYSDDISTDKAGASGVNNGGEVCDKAENCTTCPANQTVKIDKTDPKCFVSGGGSWTNQNVTLKGTCKDEGSDCKPETEIVTKEFTEEQNSSQSPGTVYDNAGNSKVCGTAAVKIDKTPPDVSITAGSNNYKLKGSASDTGSEIASTSWSGGVDSNGTSTGSGATAYYTATDNAGNSASTSHDTYKSCTKTISDKAYYWGSRSGNCSSKNINYNNFHEYECICDKHMKGVCRTNELNTHTNNQATIHYDSVTACNDKKNGNIYNMCTQSGFFSAVNPEYFHGYHWYNGGKNSNIKAIPGGGKWTIDADNSSTTYDGASNAVNSICAIACSKR